MEKYAIILAAGRGSRMKSVNENHSKVSFPILGRPMIEYVLDAIAPLDIEEKVVVVGFGGEATSRIVKDRAKIVWQHELKGTGHAVLQTSPILEKKKGCTIILCGDTPLLTSNTISELYKKHEKFGNDLTILTSYVENSKGYGRIVREYKTNHILGIREEKDCSDEEKDIHEINAGVYVVDNTLLFKYLSRITPNNMQSEYYLTDIVSMFVKDGLKVDSYVLEDAEEIYGINDRFQLAYADKIIRKRTNKKLMFSGVSIEDPDTAYISPDVVIGRDTIIKANTTILGKTVIGEGNFIGPNVYIQNVKMGNGNNVVFSYLKNTTVGDKEYIGPFEKREK